MDWLKELLKKAGVDEAKIDGIVGDITKELPKFFMPKDKYNETAEAKKKLETDLQARDNQLEDLKKTAGANDDLKKQIETLQAENKTAKEQWESTLAKMQRDHALDKALTAAKARNPKAVIALLDTEKITLDGDKLLGLTDQLDALKKSDAYLFGEPEKVGDGTNPPGGGNEPLNIDQQIEQALKDGNTVLAIKLKNKKYFSKE